MEDATDNTDMFYVDIPTIFLPVLSTGSVLFFHRCREDNTIFKLFYTTVDKRQNRVIVIIISSLPDGWPVVLDLFERYKIKQHCANQT